MGHYLTGSQLFGRCGGCRHFNPLWSPYRGVCSLGPLRKTWRGKPTSSYRQQSQMACARYESGKEPAHEP